MLLVGEVKNKERIPAVTHVDRSSRIQTISVEENQLFYDLFNADEVFLTGTAAEIIPVVSIDGRVISSGKPGKFTLNLIKEFHKLTGCAVLLNTSFNRRGEPIVCIPEDALECFIGSGLDYLVMEDILVDKKEIR